MHPSLPAPTLISQGQLSHGLLARGATLGTGQRSLTYGYDNVGNATSITESTRSGRTTRSPIGYDEIDRLTSVTGFAGGAYTYDPFGNRKSSTVTGTPASYTYESATARLTSFTGSGTLTYDGNGSLKNDGRPYSYTPENLLEIVGPPASPVATYRYDGDNLRTLKIDNVTNSTRYYVHGLGGEILSEFEEPCAGNRQLVRDYVYAQGRLLADVKPAVPAVQVGFVQASSSPSEAVGTLNVAVQITTATATACPVNVRFTTADGTATAGTDYALSTGTLRFDTGSHSGDVRTIQVTLLDNTVCQGNRTFSIQLFDASGASIVSGTHTVTIVEDDLVCLSGTKSVFGAFTAGGAVDYTVVLANSGSQTQRDNAGHEFTDALSSFLTLDSVTASSGTASKTGNAAFWDGTVAPGSPVTITMRTHANSNSALQVIANTGAISYDLHNTATNAQATATNLVSFMVGSGAISFYTVTPCRIVDTRNPAGPVGGPALSAGASRVFPMAGYCGIPAGATAVSLNVTVVDPTVVGNVALYPAGITPPATSTINYVTGITRANNAATLLNNGQLEVMCRQVSGTVDVVVDVNGYFQ
jgi:YD repeat-containing protein